MDMQHAGLDTGGVTAANDRLGTTYGGDDLLAAPRYYRIMTANQNRPPFTETEQSDYVECSHCKNPFPIAQGNGSDDFPLCDVCNDD